MMSIYSNRQKDGDKKKVCSHENNFRPLQMIYVFAKLLALSARVIATRPFAAEKIRFEYPTFKGALNKVKLHSRVGVYFSSMQYNNGIFNNTFSAL